MVALFNAHRNKRTRESINIITKFGVSSRIIKFGISESILIRELLANTVKNIWESIAENALLWPRILTVSPSADL